MILGIIGHEIATVSTEEKFIKEQINRQISGIVPDAAQILFKPGVGLWAAECCVNMGVEFSAVQPFENYSSHCSTRLWLAKDKNLYDKLIEQAAYVWNVFSDDKNILNALFKSATKCIENSDLSIIVQGHHSDMLSKVVDWASSSHQSFIVINPYNRKIRYENIRSYSV